MGLIANSIENNLQGIDWLTDKVIGSHNKINGTNRDSYVVDDSFTVSMMSCLPLPGAHLFEVSEKLINVFWVLQMIDQINSCIYDEQGIP